MKSSNAGFLACVALTLGLGSISPAAHAYIDPGTGSILLQGLIATFAAAAAAAGVYWERIKNFFMRRGRETPTDDEDGGDRT
jgi:hypothetical protein